MYNSDKPITCAEDDLLGRSSFAINDNLIIEKAVFFDYPSYYRQRAYSLKHDMINVKPLNPFNYRLSTEEVLSIKKKYAFPGVLGMPLSHQILWFLNAIEVNDHTLLDEYTTFFEKINKVTSGGVNTYKMNGWMVHVLYVYQLVSYNIPNNILPVSIGYNNDLDPFSFLSDKYNSMSSSFRIILKILALIHDIGIVDGVQNHGPNGEKYVSFVLNDLALDESFWLRCGLSYDDVLIILKILTKYHTLINKISAEDSDDCIRDKCRDIENCLNKMHNFVDYQEITSCLLLIGAADVIAVDDSLYTLKKKMLLVESYSFLNSVFSGKKFERNHERVALHRLGEMVYEKTYSDIKTDTINAVREFQFSYFDFCEGLFSIYQIDYAISYLKPLNSLYLSVKILCAIIKYLQTNFASCIISQTVIRFDSSMDFNCFKNTVENESFLQLERHISLSDSFSNSVGIMFSHDIKKNILKIHS